MEYVRINKEYDFVKKRALVNFLSNSREGLEHHFHSRTQNMLNSIEMFENNNLKNLLDEIGKGALDKIQSSLNDPEKRAEIDQGIFESALAGIRSGVMTYENDPLLPIITEEINTRTEAFKGLSAEEESKLLQLTQDQKRIISSADKASKTEFLSALPKLSNPGVKLHEKYLGYVNSISSSAH